MGHLRDDERANDIVQDSYERLWRHVAEIEYPVVKSWLFSTAYNNMIDIIRKDKRMTNLELEHEKELIYESQYSDLNEILHVALNRLPEQQKTSVMLRDYEGYSYKEIGNITGLSEAQVKINIYRGRVALKNFIGKIETVL
jgi:RNA polymerase sigma-70 factor (ECF subfamily)